ncbi:unnamed protein product [Symbiodinium pilosum]|uniref:Sulfotransferase domain-containing protein n=1 Tax=Symbiodinium pilosum TaxID=2952 RepID=A0A812T754_SYMPI|nr:unnamed protein product [Symbiodinium pilosum]
MNFVRRCTFAVAALAVGAVAETDSQCAMQLGAKASKPAAAPTAAAAAADEMWTFEDIFGQGSAEPAPAADAQPKKTSLALAEADSKPAAAVSAEQVEATEQASETAAETASETASETAVEAEEKPASKAKAMKKEPAKALAKAAGAGKKSPADKEDYVAAMVQSFLEKPLPKKNDAVSETRPLVFLHQHRAGGTTLRKLLYNETMELMTSLSGKQVSCLTNFREPMARITSCYAQRLVQKRKVAPACMGKLDAKQLKTLLVNYGCVNEPFRRLGQCGVQTHADATDKKARMQIWNNTLQNLASCVPILVDKQDTFAAAVKQFPQFKQAFWHMKKQKLNSNAYPKDCAIPTSHIAVIKELAEQEMILYEAAKKRALAIHAHSA